MSFLSRILLTPLSWIYGLVVNIRNFLFDNDIIKSKRFDVPVISIGNLVMGGTGKTPHIEYLTELLKSQRYEVAILSRGYGRRTSGFVLADYRSNATDVGDESAQIKRKFGEEVIVAVDEKRVHGITKLLSGIFKPNVILLDDAFQHRYVTPTVNILLTDYHNLFSDDKLLPLGTLREPAEGKRRADIVIMTKCPPTLQPIDYNILTKYLDLFPYQKLFFSTLRYEKLKPLFPDVATDEDITEHVKKSEILALSGIADSTTMIEQLSYMTQKVHALSFSDHHYYTSSDLLKIQRLFWSLPSGRRFIITTEKDASRLIDNADLNEILKPYIYVLPVRIEILRNKQAEFNQTILDYVRKNPGNSSIY